MLKQSSRVWFRRFISVGSRAWTSSFPKESFCFLSTLLGKMNSFLVLVYVDDIMITSDDAQWISELNAGLQNSRFGNRHQLEVFTRLGGTFG